MSRLGKCGTKYFTVAVSLERYIAICHPFKVQFWLTQTRVAIYTGIVVTFAIILSIFSYIYKRNSELSDFRIYTVFMLHIIPLSCVIFLNLNIYFGVSLHGTWYLHLVKYFKLTKTSISYYILLFTDPKISKPTEIVNSNRKL